MSQYLPYSLRGNMRKFFVNFITRHYSKPTMIMVIREGIQSKITLHKLLLPVFRMYLCVCHTQKNKGSFFIFIRLADKSKGWSTNTEKNPTIYQEVIFPRNSLK